MMLPIIYIIICNYIFTVAKECNTLKLMHPIRGGIALKISRLLNMCQLIKITDAD